MASKYITSTAGFLEASAAAAMRDAAENTIKETVAAFEKIIREKVYDEVSKLSIKYVESLYENADPLNRKRLHIVIDDRRETK
jgi:hypothetical protein